MVLFTIWEIAQIAITVVVVGFIFSSHIRKPRTELEDFISNNLWDDIKYAAIAAAPAVVLHELMHKFVAISYGFSAHYVASWWGLAIGAILKIVGSRFIFFLPGYVSIQGLGTALQFGLTALAGPLTNLVIGFFFLGVTTFSAGMIQTIFLIGSQINFYLGFFNMLPLFVLDGKKVFDWNKGIWAITFVVLLLLSFGLPYFF